MSYIVLPNITNYCCIETAIKKIKNLNKENSFQNKISQIALIALAEIGAIFDLLIESTVFFKKLLYKTYNYSIPTYQETNQFLIKITSISHFFIGFIPFIIFSKLNLNNLDPILLKDPSTIKQNREEIKMNTVKIIKKIIENYDQYLNNDISYFEKFCCIENDVDSLLANIEQLIFWTNTKNYGYLLSEPLTESELQKSIDLHKFYKSMLTLHQLFGKFYPPKSILVLTKIIGNNFLEIENIIGYKADTIIQKKIFQTFKKLFILKLEIDKTTAENYETIDLLNKSIIYIYNLFNKNLLSINKKEQKIEKLIAIRQENIQQEFDYTESTVYFIEKFLLFLNQLPKSSIEIENLATKTMQESLKNCLKRKD